MKSEGQPFNPKLAITALADAGVRFVLIGGMAAGVHGSSTITYDLDICYAGDHENLEQLSTVLKGLKATLRGAPKDIPFLLDAETLRRGDWFTFDTSSGALDILATPAGSGGFEDLERTAISIELYGTTVLVAGLDDLIEMKVATGRPKDRMAAEILGALRDTLEARGELD